VVDAKAALSELEDAPTLLARFIGILASAKRPLRLFKTVSSAKRWHERLAASSR
jgi:hypothetical protein